MPTRQRQLGHNRFESLCEIFSTYYRARRDFNTTLTKSSVVVEGDVLGLIDFWNTGIELRYVGDQIRVFKQAKAVAAF